MFPDAPKPDPDVLTYCNDLVREWQSGERDFSDVASDLQLIIDETDNPANEALAEYQLGYMQGYRAHYDVSIAHFQIASDISERIGDQRTVLNCTLSIGENYRHKGDFTGARQLFQQVSRTAGEQGRFFLQSYARHNEGLVLLALDQLASARAAFDEALHLCEEWTDEQLMHLPAFQSSVHCSLAEVDLQEGYHESAWGHARQSLELAFSVKQPPVIAHISRVMGNILTTIDAPPEADIISTDPDDYYMIAIESFREIKAEGEVGRTLYAHALSLAERGQNSPARRKLQQAMFIFARLGMTDDAAKASEAQYRLG